MQITGVIGLHQVIKSILTVKLVGNQELICIQKEKKKRMAHIVKVSGSAN